MPWGEKTVEEKREAFCEACQAQIGSMTELCRTYGISRKTGYKWLNRAQQGESMSDRSRLPHTSPTKIDGQTEQMILEKRRQHPAWGAKKLHEVLLCEGHGMPSVRTVHNVLKRNGLIDREESLKHRPYQRFERAHCNELWQTDFKGDFALGDGSRCYPLTIIDDHSRYAILVEARSDTRDVTESFRRVFEQYGKPEALLSDNGAQFAGFGGGYTRFERWLMEQDVLPVHGRPRHPQTQGKIERFHRSMKAEALRDNSFDDLSHARKALSAWRTLYNEVRPHEALGGQKPAQVYQRSARLYLPDVQKTVYSGDHPVCKVNSWGYLRWMDYRVYLSETFANTYLEIRLAQDQLWVCYRNFRIAAINTISGKRLHRSISRL